MVMIGLKHYERMGIIDMRSFDMDHMIKRAKINTTSYFNLPYEIIPGTFSLLEKLLTGIWDEDEFLIINPGDTVLYEDLYSKSSSNSG